MRAISFILLLICFTISAIAQPTTFNITVNDTLNLSNWSPRPIEYPVGTYSVAGDGYGLSLIQGGYQQIYQVNEQGELIRRHIKYEPTRRYFGASKFIKTIDNNFILTSTRSLLGGTGGNRIFAMKISPDLTDTLWTYFHSDSLYFDTTADLIEADNGDIYISARRRPFDNDSMLGVFIRLNVLGEFITQRIIRERKVQGQQSLIDLSDGNIMIGGTRGPNSGDLRGFLMKISPEGEILWSQDYPQITECGMSLYNDSTIILSGYIYPTGRAKLLLIDTAGALKINKTIIFPNSTSISYIGRRFSDGGIISVGLCTNNDLINNNDGYIMKADSLGNLLWQKSYRFTDGDFVEYFTDFIETSDGGILISGSAVESNANGGQNSWLIKLDANGCLDPQDCGVSIKDMPLPDALTIYPNPANEYLNLKIEQGSGIYSVYLHDATGRLVQHETLSGIGSHTLQVAQLHAGVYFCTVRSANGDFMGTERIVIIQY